MSKINDDRPDWDTEWVCPSCGEKNEIESEEVSGGETYEECSCGAEIALELMLVLRITQVTLLNEERD